MNYLKYEHLYIMIIAFVTNLVILFFILEIFINYLLFIVKMEQISF